MFGTKPDLDVQLNLMGVDQKNKTPRKQHVNPKAHIKINGNFRIPKDGGICLNQYGKLRAIC